MYNDPSWANAGWLALDVVCAIAPLVPAVGVVRHAGKIEKILDKSADAAKAVDKATDVAKVADKGADAAKATKIHGNSLDSPKETTVYQLKTKEGEYLKTGMTSENPIENRYNKKFMKDKKMKEIDKGSRREMAQKEKELIKQNPGPLNNERWLKNQD